MDVQLTSARIRAPHLSAQPPIHLQDRKNFEKLVRLVRLCVGRERREIFRAISLRLRSACPPLRALSSVKRTPTTFNLAGARCIYARLSLQGLEGLLIVGRGHEQQDVYELASFMWPHIFRWVSFLFQDTSDLDGTVVAEIWGEDVRDVRLDLLLLLMSCSSIEPLHRNFVRGTPGFAEFIIHRWYDAANDPSDDYRHSFPCNLILRELITMHDDVDDPILGNLIKLIGGPKIFASAILAHIRRLLNATHGNVFAITEVIILLTRSLNESTHDILLEQGSLSMAISLVDYMIDAYKSSGEHSEATSALGACFKYIATVISWNRPYDVAYKAFKQNILVSIMRAAQCLLDPADADPLTKLVVELTQHLVFGSNIPVIKMSLRRIRALNLGPTQIVDKALREAWENFLTVYNTMYTAKKDLPSGRTCLHCQRAWIPLMFGRCSTCGCYYCSRACQVIDWDQHRPNCRSSNDLGLSRDEEHLMSYICASKVVEYPEEISLLYQKYVLTFATNNLPPLALVVNCSKYPPIISAGHSDIVLAPLVGIHRDSTTSEVVLMNMFGNDSVLKEQIVYLLEFPTMGTNSYFPVQTSSRFLPPIPYKTYAEFLHLNKVCKGGEASATKKALDSVEMELRNRCSLRSEPLEVTWISKQTNLHCITVVRV